MTLADLDQRLEQAATWVRDAKRFVITAGAGMGADSGLPTFRGAEGFWKAYPAFRQLGLEWRALARPKWFEEDPELAWGFYGHRVQTYRETAPHQGYHILKSWCQSRPSFVFTTNVDAAFQEAGWGEEQINEVHGSLSWLQCTALCHRETWSAEGHDFHIDATSCRARSPLPMCPKCNRVARPNVVLFGDHTFTKQRTTAQRRRYESWLTKDPGLVVIEVGAGVDIPTARRHSRHLQVKYKANVIRINPENPEGASGMISLQMGARDALSAIQARVEPGAA